MLNLILRILERNKGNLFQPIIVSEKTQRYICKEISKNYNCALISNLYHYLTNEHQYRQFDVIVVKLSLPLTSTELYACNLGREAFAGFGKPVLWFLSEEQQRQLQGCPDLWSCASIMLMEDYDED
jgi:hypothetical protein